MRADGIVASSLARTQAVGTAAADVEAGKSCGAGPGGWRRSGICSAGVVVEIGVWKVGDGGMVLPLERGGYVQLLGGTHSKPGNGLLAPARVRFEQILVQAPPPHEEANSENERYMIPFFTSQTADAGTSALKCTRKRGVRGCSWVRGWMK